MTTKITVTHSIEAGLGNYKIKRIIRKSNNLYFHQSLHFIRNFIF